MQYLLYLLINVLFLVVSYLIGLFTLYFYPKYMGQKGKNLATKEDIGDITTIVENIKNDLVKDVEFLKSELSLMNENKISLKSEERKALLDFHIKYSLWHNSIVHLSTPSSKDEIDNILKTWDQLESEYKTAESILNLFVHEKEFFALRYRLYSSTLDNLKLCTDYLSNLKAVFDNYEINKPNIFDEIALQKHSEYLDERRTLSAKFRAEAKEMYPELSQLSVDMTMAIKKLLFAHGN